MYSPFIAQQTVNDFGLNFPGVKYNASLAATTDTTLTIPGSAPRWKVILKCEPGAIVWVALNAVAAIPAGTTFAATTSELLTEGQLLCREVKAGDVIHFYSAAGTVDVSAVLYAVGTPN